VEAVLIPVGMGSVARQNLVGDVLRIVAPVQICAEIIVVG